jgi:hypothetical protein
MEFGFQVLPTMRWPTLGVGRKVRPTLDKCPGSNFLRTNLDWFEANWILELGCTLVPSLILGSPNQELSF